IVVDRVSRTFRVYPKAQRTLKDLFVSRGRLRAREVQALRDVSLTIEPGGAVGLVGRNGSGKSTLLRLVSGIITPTSGRIEAGGRIASLLELGAGFHPDFTGRENVYLNGSIHGLSRARVREAMDEIVSFAELEQFIDLPVRTYSSGMFMRLGFSVAAHIEADVLLLDEVFAVGDEQFQRKCFGKIAEFKNRGGTIVFVSHDAQAVERLCDRAVLLRQGELAFDGPTQEAIAAYRRLLGADANPDELEAGLREWGTGEARIVSAALLDGDGDERPQFASGEPIVVRLVVEAEEGVAAPRVTLELRDDDGVVLGTVSKELGALGWSGGGRREVRFRLDRLPLAEGRFHLRFALADAATGAPLHALDDALRFFVFPADGESGLVRLEGEWSMEDSASAAPTSGK
ncbi:MAG TPA: ABC transporter ATP-binding protein, partial [Gaiellaceae bacterium]|nr:ABC transporter ATP-binding protein [Gaiellaceae bacterium]